MVIIRTDKEDPLLKGRIPHEAYWKLQMDFIMEKKYKNTIYGMKENFTPDGLVLFIRSYARKKKNGSLETWADAVVRVIEATFLFKKYQALPNQWNEEKEQKLAFKMAKYMFLKRWLPAGRGLFSMSKEYVKKFGSMALNNCAFISSQLPEGNISLALAIQWMMYASMLGVGVGFDTKWDGEVFNPSLLTEDAQFYEVDDSREGWAYSTYLLMESYLLKGKGQITFDYSKIRAKGEPILSYGGVAGGPDPLILLHKQIRSCFDCYYRVHNEGMKAKDSIRMMLYEMKDYDSKFANIFESTMKTFEAGDESFKTFNHSYFVTNLFNMAGVCVIDGNVFNRTAQIALGEVGDDEFIHLKNHERFPERVNFQWISNNSVTAEKPEDYPTIAKTIAPLILKNGEPGIFNKYLANQFDPKNPRRHPKCDGVNPCNEVPLENGELCNVPDVFWVNCPTLKILLKACKYASLYGSVVTLIPTFDKRSQDVIDANHRIGVCLHSLFVKRESESLQRMTEIMDKCYELIKETTDTYVYERTGIYCIAHTSIKPGGKTPRIAGAVPGLNALFENRFVEFRMSIEADLVLSDALIEHGLQYEVSESVKNTNLFIFPIDQGTCRTNRQVSSWESLLFQVFVQKHLVDNCISCTHNIPKNTPLETLISMIEYFLPLVKGFCFLPFEATRELQLLNGHSLILDVETDDKERNKFLDSMTYHLSDEQMEYGKSAKFISYSQKTFTGISKERCKELLSSMPTITTDLITRVKGLTPSDGSSTKFCDSEHCELVPKKI